MPAREALSTLRDSWCRNHDQGLIDHMSVAVATASSDSARDRSAKRMISRSLSNATGPDECAAVSSLAPTAESRLSQLNSANHKRHRNSWPSSVRRPTVRTLRTVAHRNSDRDNAAGSGTSRTRRLHDNSLLSSGG